MGVGGDGSTGHFWRSGKLLKMQVDALLPCRCVKCNEPAEVPMKGRTYYWHPPGWYLLILLGVLIYAIVALCVRKKAVVAAGLCSRHRAARSRNILIAWLSFLGAIALFIWGRHIEYSALIGLGLILFSLILGVGFTRILAPTHMDGEVLTFTGCGEAFLRELPSV